MAEIAFLFYDADDEVERYVYSMVIIVRVNLDDVSEIGYFRLDVESEKDLQERVAKIWFVVEISVSGCCCFG